MTAASEPNRVSRRSSRRADTTALPPRTITARTWADVCVIVVLSGIGMLGMSTAFTDAGYLLAGFGGIAVGTLLALIAARYRLPAVVTAVLAIFAYFLLGNAIAIPQQSIAYFVPTAQSLTGLAIGAVFGWSDLLTLHAPVSLPYYVNAVPYLAGWLVALISVTLASRWLIERQRTARRGAMVLIAPIALYLTGVLLGTDQPYFAAVRGIAFAALALVWLGWRRQAGERLAVGAGGPILRRKVLGTVVIVAIAATIGAVGGAAVAPAEPTRFVLREKVQPPFTPLNYPAPLAGFRHYTKDIDQKNLFTVSGLSDGQRLRLAAMDSYNGVIWKVAGAQAMTDGSGSFRLVSSKIPLPTTPFDHGSTSVLKVTVLDYHDVWIPDTGFATSITFGSGSAAPDPEGLRYNSATGTAVLTSGVTKGQTYTITAVNQKVPTDSVLEKIPTAAMQLPPVDDIPATVRAKALDIVAKQTTPIDRLRHLAEYLKSNGFFSHGTASDQAPSAAGQGADRMAEMVTSAHMVGDQEQYASLFAMMARSLGYPARVVMGFAPTVRSGGGPVTVTGDDVTAWVEVPFQGVGWIPFLPTPNNPDVPQDQTPKPKTEPQPQVRQPPRSETKKDDNLTATQVNDSKKKNAGLPFSLPAWAIAVGGGILVLLIIVLVPMIVVGIVKLRRRRRRRRDRGDRAVAWAWAELLDRLDELGYPRPMASTRGLVAEEVADHLPTEAAAGVTLLAVRTDQDVFSGIDIQPTRVDAAWQEADDVVAIAQREAGGRRRALSRYRLGAARRWAARLSAQSAAARDRRQK
ncbi:MAG: transglutaminase domain-containing protein [Pseudolysinimonas sp.]